MASDGSVDNVERLNALYKKSMLEKREMFVSSLQNAPEVAERLFELEVLTMHEKIAIVSKPIRQHQKEALFYMLVMKKFEEIDRIIKALELTQNESLRATLKLFKIRLWNQCHFDKNIIKPATLQEDDSGLDLVGDSVVNVGDDTDTKGSSGCSSSESEKDEAPAVGDTRARSVPFDDGFKGRGRSIIASDNIPMFPILKPLIPPTPPSRRPSRKKKAKQTDSVASFHQAASDGNIEVLEHLLKSDISPYEVDDSGRTPLHVAVLGKFSKDSLKCMEMMITRYVELLLESSESSCVEEKKLEFLNHQDKKGLTVMHLAAENESVEIVRRLYDKHHCDIFIRCKEGLTPLEIMYIKTPEAIIHLLNGALPTTNNHPSDGKFSLELDFRTVIGSAHDKQSQNDENHRYSETGMLAKLVHQNKSASKIILPHVIVKTFLDLKWQKMKFWLFTSMYVQIFLHLWYTCFVVEVFLIQCPYAIHSRKSRDVGLLENSTTMEGVTKDDEVPRRNIFSYLFGDWESVEQAFYIFPRTNKHEQVCDLNPSLKCQAIALLIIGILFFFKEFFEVLLVNNIFSRGAGGSSEGKWSRFYEGTKAYLSSVENIFQLIFITLMVLVCTLAFRTKISDFYYSAAALSVVVAWALILMQVGNISGLGTYVQILGKVIKSFGTLMGTYLVLIIAFSIAFSIMFPREKPFETLPKAFSRVIIMMTGELNYDETFYSQEDPQGGPPIPLTGHIIYTCFTILLTIILINLLIGMVVSDVQGLRGKSEVILRSIQVEQLYVMETSLIRLRWIFLPIQKLINRFTGKNSGKKTTYLDIFVINPNDINDAKGMVLKKSIKDIPKKLQKEIRTLAGDVNEYMKEYMNKYLNN